MHYLFWFSIGVAITCFIGLIVCSLFILIYSIEEKIQEKNRVKINKCIKKALDCYCEEKQIKVIWEDRFNEEHRDAAAYINYHTMYDGRVADAEIHLLNSSRRVYEYLSWATYAHEVGHYISVNYFGDNSEEGADLEARRLIEQILPEKDRKLINSTIIICFSYGDYEHPVSNYIPKTFIESEMYFRKELKLYYERIRNNAD